VFRDVPGFQAALAVERALKSMSRVDEVQVADFEERRLTLQVTHDLGQRIADEVASLDAVNVDVISSEPDRAELRFRA
jgi:hypothetical protein